MARACGRSATLVLGRALSRRDFIKTVAASAGTVAATSTAASAASARSPVVATVERLTFPWQTSDPFLFCVHHDDAYPKGNEQMGPAATLDGRRLGMDFGGKDGWSMYHGEVVPGFPQHPHRGFETLTVARRGFIDHSDSLGATARFGGGDAQWMTAGRGIVHAEMFPLRERKRDNPTELFQIWLNLPRANKFVEPYFTMLWRETIPTHRRVDQEGRATEITTIAGALDERPVPKPPPSSWAAQPDAAVAVWSIRMDPGASWTLPATAPGVGRSVYVFGGDALDVGGRTVPAQSRAVLHDGLRARLTAGPKGAQILLLQGRAIGEPVVQHGPFVMNTREEIQQAFFDYRQTGFGGWPWPSDAPVHARDESRFAKHADGRVERRTA